MALITYEDKVAINPQPEVANQNKVTDSDMNEIKTCVNDNCTYSTNEVCIGEFMGKPLYRMTLESTTYATQYVFPTSNVEKIIRVDGILQRSDYITIWQPIPGRLDNANFSSQFTTITNTGNLEVNLALGTSWSASFRRIILYVEYTKTTD